MGHQISEHPKKEVAFAWAVHAFTASGVVLGFLAVVAILEGDKIAAFIWLGLALFVDGIDGTLARRVRVREVTPQVDGSTLDNVVDFFNYVAVPALMIYWFGMVPPGLEIITAAGIMAVSCYTFSNVGIKTSDFYFVGFPALWNLPVLYFYVLQTDLWTNFWVIVFLAMLTFVPLKVVHPLRVKDRRAITLSMTVLWAATSLALVLLSPDVNTAWQASPIMFWLWVAASVYFAILCLWRSLHGKTAE
jgi:phosphatidylcholine synthase